MKVEKLETNLKRKLFLASSLVAFSSSAKKTENQVIRY